jgi:hypothetical protein
MTNQLAIQDFTIEQIETLINQLWDAIEIELDPIQKIRINQLRAKCVCFRDTMLKK